MSPFEKREEKYEGVPKHLSLVKTHHSDVHPQLVKCKVWNIKKETLNIHSLNVTDYSEVYSMKTTTAVPNKLKCIGIPPSFSAMFSKDNNFCDFLFTSLDDVALPKWVCS